MTILDGKSLKKGNLDSECVGQSPTLHLPPAGALYLGIDVGSVSCKVAILDERKNLIFSSYERTHGRPMQTARKVLAELMQQIPAGRIASIVGTGSAGRTLCQVLGIDFINELICQAAAIGQLHPEVRTLVEMGGQDSKVIILCDPSKPKSQGGGELGEMKDFATNTNCAAGTGSFLDQQASRLNVDIEGEFGVLALKSEVPPRVAGRCSVFAKSDMIHLQQQATPVHDIVAGLCLGLARNLKSSLCQGKEVVKPVAFCGGVASNAGVVRALEDVFELGKGGLIVPPEHAVTGAIGAILAQMKQGAGPGSLQEARVLLSKLDHHIKENHTIGHRIEPLKKPTHDAPASKVHKELVAEARHTGKKIKCYLGVDIGSISTKVLAMDEQNRVLGKIYLMTAGRPLEAVCQGLDIVGREVADVVEVIGVATTGSGRYLVGDFVGADLVINEITAQATGAAIVDPDVDTIFEIGGQDSKFISLEGGVVVDFEMNHACAAGTGSFIEEQAERLGISIKEEFAKNAFASTAPIRLGERCTVFMESDLLSYQQQGAERPDLVAGLSYSIVTNYLNRVVGHRAVGKKVFFQGGTAFNRAVVSAFEMVTGKPIIVPDHHEVTGALGAAELARRHMEQLRKTAGREAKSNFKGFERSQTKYEVKSFECTHCANNCEIKEVLLPGAEPLFYGSRCDLYNVKKQQDKIEMADLFRERQEMLEKFGRIGKKTAQAAGAAPTAKKKKTIGIPMCLSNYQFLPLWGTFFDELGFEVVTSGRSTKSVIHEGVEAVLSQTCFPVKVAHGHVLELVNKGVDYIWLPSVVSMTKEYPENQHNQLCPYVQTIPYQVRIALMAKGIILDGEKNHLLFPHIRFQEGVKVLRRNLYALTRKLGLGKGEINRALEIAQAAQRSFEESCRARGREVLAGLKPDQKASVIVSRPYNGCDPGISLDLPRKLRKMNVLAIPMDFLDYSTANVTEPELQVEMYWKYGQRIFRAAHIIRDNPRLSAIFMSNFSCGPDSFIITFFKELLTLTKTDGSTFRKPALVLEIDEHSADAGVVTRLEAFLESLKAVEGRHPEESLRQGPAVQAPDSPWRFNWGDCNERTLYIPWMGDSAHALAAAFRHCGQDAPVLPIAAEAAMRWGRRFTTGKECLPCAVTTGDMLKIMHQPGADPDKMAFFMPGSSGPCRFGQYSCLQRLVLRQSGFPNTIPVVSPNQDSEFYDHFKRFRKDPTRLAFDGIAAQDLLLKVLHKVRPYEVTPGSADAAYQKSLGLVIAGIEKGLTEDQQVGVMRQCAQVMAGVEVDRSRTKPLVVIVGEIYVRSHTFANDNVIRHLESLGAEISQAGISEWLYYTNHTRKLMAVRWRNLKLYLQNLIKGHVQHKIERRLAQPLEEQFGPLAERDIREVIAAAESYMHESFEGEAILSIGKIMELYHHGASGAVNVMPFTCMPSTIVSAISRQMVIDSGGMPILNISYDGQQDPTLPTRLEAFMHQVHSFAPRQVSAAVAAH